MQLGKMPQKFLHLVKTRIRLWIVKVSVVLARPSKGENGTSDVILGLYAHHLGYCPYKQCPYEFELSVFSSFVKERLFNSEKKSYHIYW